MRRRRVLIIFNPAAGRRRRPRLEAHLRDLSRRGAVVTLRETGAPGDAEIFAREADAREFDAVLAAGGDGTINEVINGLGPGSPPLGLLPLGTANVLAAEIDMPHRSEAIADLLLEGPVREIWPGEVNGRRFAMMAGIGFDAAVVDRVSVPLKRRLGKGAYVLEAMRQFVAYRPARYSFTLDEYSRTAASAIVCRGRRYGGRYVCAPSASVFERRFDVCLFERAGRFDMLRAVLRLGVDRLAADRNVTIVQARHIHVSGAEGDPVQCDGNIICRLPAEFRLADAPVRLIASPEAPRS